MVTAMTQQSTAMMQQHEASMQRQTTSLEQQQLVMQQMEAARVVLRKSTGSTWRHSASWRRTGWLPLCLALSHDHQLRSGVWKTS